MIKINSEYSIARCKESLYILHVGKWVLSKNLYDSNNLKVGNCSLLCRKEDPVVYLTTNNISEIQLRNILPLVKGAVCKKKELTPWMDEDPYGRKVQRGWLSYEAWDLSTLFSTLKESEIERIEREWIDEYKLLSV